MSKLIDITGQVFGKLTVMYRSENTSKGQARWHCKCECGNECDVVGTKLRNGHTKSCGCYQKQQATKATYNNLLSQTYGLLTVIEDAGFGGRSSRGHLWKCKCECGNEIIVNAADLRTGDVKSCGCLKSSYGERKIRELLTLYNIPFQEQVSLGCYFKDTNRPAKFDFYVNNKYVIEYDGVQHYKIGTGVYNNPEKFKKTQSHDLIKNKWCEKNNIPLIRIPYYHSDIVLEDLLLNTSNYLIEQ